MIQICCLKSQKNMHATAMYVRNLLQSRGIECAVCESPKLGAPVYLMKCPLPHEFEDHELLVPAECYTMDKLQAYEVVSAAGIPCVPTVDSSEWEWAFEEWGRVVAKPKRGSWGGGIMLRDVPVPIPPNHVIQPFYPIDLRKDIRCNIANGKAICAINFVPQPGNWNANMAHGGVMHRIDLTEEMVEMGKAVSDATGLPVCGIDFFLTPDGLLFNEVNCLTDFWDTQRILGVNVNLHIADCIERLYRERGYA